MLNVSSLDDRTGDGMTDDFKARVAARLQKMDEDRLAFEKAEREAEEASRGEARQRREDFRPARDACRRHLKTTVLQTLKLAWEHYGGGTTFSDRESDDGYGITWSNGFQRIEFSCFVRDRTALSLSAKARWGTDGNIVFEQKAISLAPEWEGPSIQNWFEDQLVESIAAFKTTSPST